MNNIQFNKTVEERVKAQQSVADKSLSPYAFPTCKATRLSAEQDDLRPAFFHDIDRILYSSAYSRYIDKTQVFYLIENDHITHRVLHVQLVSKIARTIGYFLNLNLDLIEAISLGHDVGHTPFGHNGESIISTFCRQNKCGVFCHNVQSFRLFHLLENNGMGDNLTTQVLDGIICHNGEVLNNSYSPDKNKTPDRLLEEYENSLLDVGVTKRMHPMTLEGCVMRISDIIAYVGRDIEDAIVVDLIKRNDLPVEATRLLGNTNRDIVNRLIIDLVNNSIDRDRLAFSPEVFRSLDILQRWNYERIYRNPRKMIQDNKIENMFNVVLNACLEDLEKDSRHTHICDYLSEMSSDYCQSTNPARIVADYVSGMTDDYLLNTFKELTVPTSFGMGFKAE